MRFGTFLLVAGALLRLIFLLFSFFGSKKWSTHLTLASCSKCHLQIQNWWKRQTNNNKGTGRNGCSRNDQELDVMRCNWTRRFWSVVFVIAVYRLVHKQIVLALDQDGISADFDLTILLVGIFGIVLSSFPCLINPKSQDFWYVLTMFILDVTYFIPPVEVDVRDVITFSFPGRFVYAVLAKRIGCVAICILFHMLQAIQMARLQTDLAGTTYSLQALVFMFFLMFLGMVIVRRLMRENVLLRVDLQKRTVELGAVSSLLTACYDAVLELDQHLTLTQDPMLVDLADSCQLSSMLLQTAPKTGGLSGKSLLDFFAEGDRQRISEQILSSDSENISVVALNADMLDSDFNHVKVELFCAQFRNLANERCFLTGLREIQDLEPCAPTVWDSAGHSNPDPVTLEGQDLLVVYDVCTFDIQVMSGEMQHLCQRYMDEPPDYILDLASTDTQTFLCQQLQHLGNAAQQLDSPPEIPASVTFDLLGLGEVKAVVSIEYDHLLDALMGSMVIHLRSDTGNTGQTGNALTESNLRNLGSLQSGQSRQPRGVRPSLPSLPSRRRSERSHGSHGSHVSRGSTSSSPSRRSRRSSRSSPGDQSAHHRSHQAHPVTHCEVPGNVNGNALQHLIRDSTVSLPSLVARHFWLDLSCGLCSVVHAMASQVNVNGLGPVSVHVLHGTGLQPTIAYVPAQRFVVTPQPFTGVRTSQSIDPGRAAVGIAPGVPAGLPSGKAPAVAMQVRYLQSPLPAAPKEAVQVPSAGSLLSKGLCRQSTGENLATYFDHGRRRKTAAPKVVEEVPRSPKRLQPQQPTSILQDLNSGPDLQASSPRGKPEAWSQAVKRVKHFTDRSEQLHHGPNPMELPVEVPPTRRMVHTADNPPLSERETLPQRSSSNDAAHRRSTGVWTCLESTSDGEANDRIGRRRWLPHYSSSGAARGMQLQAEKPEALQENPSGEETANGFPSGRRHSQRRHLQSRETGTLVDGLSTRSPEEWQQVALGGKRRGRTSEGAKEYCRRNPGPWEQLPEGVVKKDAWGRRKGFTAEMGDFSENLGQKTLNKRHLMTHDPHGDVGYIFLGRDLTTPYSELNGSSFRVAR
eukprot:s1106_g16.t2